MLSYLTHSELQTMPPKVSAKATSKTDATSTTSNANESAIASMSSPTTAITGSLKIEWIKHHAIHHAFAASLPDEIIASGKRTKLELITQGSVRKRFLGKTKYKHSVNLEVDEKEIKKVKNIFKSSPDFK